MSISSITTGGFGGFRGTIKEIRPDEKRLGWCYIEIEDPLGEISTMHMKRDFLEHKTMPADPIGMRVELMIGTADRTKGQRFPSDILDMITNCTVAMAVEMGADKFGSIKFEDIANKFRGTSDAQT